jgi:hypothetical protein
MPTQIRMKNILIGVLLVVVAALVWMLWSGGGAATAVAPATVVYVDDDGPEYWGPFWRHDRPGRGWWPGPGWWPHRRPGPRPPMPPALHPLGPGGLGPRPLGPSGTGPRPRRH